MRLSSPLDTFLVLILAVFQLPVHDVANHGRGDQTQKLEHAKDGRVDAHWEIDDSTDRVIMFLMTCFKQSETWNEEYEETGEENAWIV